MNDDRYRQPRYEPFTTLKATQLPPERMPPPVPGNGYGPRRPSDGFVDEYFYNTYHTTRKVIPLAIVAGVILLICILVWASRFPA